MRSVIYVNASQTLKSDGYSGIQRVVKELMLRLDGRVIDGYEFQFGALIKDKWLPAVNYAVPDHKAGYLSIFFKKIRSEISSVFSSQLYLVARKIYRSLGSYYKTTEGQELPAGAVIVEIDSVWNEYGDHNSELLLKKIYIIYDIIPITNPEFCNKNQVAIFSEWLKESLASAHGIISISKSALNDVLRYADKVNLGRNLKTGYFYLGSDFSRKSYVLGCNSSVDKILKSGKYFISVGSLEPRKNYKFLVDSFERYKSLGGSWSLVIVGRMSGNGSEIIKSIRNSDYFDRDLFYFSNASDAELSSLYKCSSGIITASLAEGFGLPLVEGAIMGKPLIASDIEVYKELGKNFANFYNKYDSDSLVSAMFLVENGGGKIFDPEVDSEHVISWDDSALSFAREIIRVV